MSTRDLLIEIGTEELPPKALNKLSDAFASGIETGLKKPVLNIHKLMPMPHHVVWRLLSMLLAKSRLIVI